MQFVKYHALGNDYLVIEAGATGGPLTPLLVRRICDRHYGIGSDGILVREAQDDQGRFPLRIFNPDGTEAEKSGNGLRILARALWDAGAVQESPFQVVTPGGVVTCQVLEGGRQVTVEMGQVCFTSTDIPVTGPRREVLRERMLVNGEELEFSAASIGNPHCVILRERVSESETRALGPLIEMSPLFPRRTNVQFVEVPDPDNLRILIWERGAGYTLASGSSSCAAAAVAHRLGLCAASVTVHVPGGQLGVEIHPDFTVRLTGPVRRVMEGRLAPEAFS